MVTCPFCGHRWTPRSDLPTLCCSQCRRKFRRPDLTVDVLKQKVRLETTCDGCGQEFKDLNVCRVDGEAALLCGTCLGSITPGDGAR